MARELVALVKPRITFLSVLTAAGGYALAPGTVDVASFAALLVGVTLLVGSANALNMYIERDADGRMYRTRNRPLPAGRLEPRIALWFGLLLVTLSLPILGFGTNLLTAWLGAMSWVLYVLIYTPLKQRTTFSLIIGAIPGAAPPLLGWTAAAGYVGAAAWGLFAVIFVWQVPHFLAIALYRRDDYVAADMKILPAVLGDAPTKRAIVSYLFLQLLVTLAIVPLGIGGTGYLLGAALLGAAMLGLGMAGLKPSAGHAWARRFFLATVVYLPVLFGLMFL